MLPEIKGQTLTFGSLNREEADLDAWIKQWQGGLGSLYKYSQNFVRPQGRWDGDTVGRKVQRWLGGSEGGGGSL